MTLKITIIILSLFLISGCSSSSESTNNSTYPNSKSTTTLAASSNLAITIPEGWREIKDNHNQLFDIWLVNNQNNAVICFIPIYLSDDLTKKTFEEKFKMIKQIVINNKKSITKDFQIVEDKNEVANYQMISIKVEIEDVIQNSILFGSENNFYECLAYYKNGFNPNSSEIELLIDIQEKIVAESSIN